MLEELYVAFGIATLVYYLVTKAKRVEVQIEITPLQPPDPDPPFHSSPLVPATPSPMSICSDLMVVSPLRFKEDYMEWDSAQNKLA